ncbi:hypothetical protein BDY19DRAFT_899115 [Irpex rosettiformis]|uniref:Uncharacterized protein n=1 Tax=Irpex rosettiformis TaxID=378272 RepID=A0ACB8TQ41_9APHY|nr:hypothetical protein BDY19DRAFT_899115 [Irpex rosettiformis]
MLPPTVCRFVATLIPVLIQLFHSPHVLAATVNITVDDMDIDNGVLRMTYEPIDAWNIGDGCGICSAHPSPAEALGGNWHDVTWWPNGTETEAPRTASLEFDGSAVYVYSIISRFPSVNTDLTFFIDDEVVGTYTWVSDGDSSFNYNVPVYSNDSIIPGAHTLKVQNGFIGGPESLLLLDYIIYS